LGRVLRLKRGFAIARRRVPAGTPAAAALAAVDDSGAGPSWTTPFVRIMVEPDLVLAMTADGGIVEGRTSV
jgi:hypothetical protein